MSEETKVIRPYGLQWWLCGAIMIIVIAAAATGALSTDLAGSFALMLSLIHIFYDPKYKRWSIGTLPFLPREFKYEVIGSVSKQFEIVKGLLNRPDVDTIYVCTDSGREGEYIYRLVAQMAGVKGKAQKRVWIDSQTEEEILRGIREAKDEAEYDLSLIHI